MAEVFAVNNRAGEMEVFVEAVERGSFTAAAERLGLSPSAISKLITRIEERLGTRLLVRSTRALQLTPEGEAYHQRAVRIIAEIEETERLMTSGGAAVPRGLLRVNSSVGFGTRCIVPLVPAFLARYPDVELDLSLSDGVIDIIEERADVAIRTGPMRDSGLKARKLGESRRVIVAAPDYLAKHGVPQTPDELAQHNCLTFNFRRSMDEWAFRYPGEERIRPIAVKGNFKANNGSSVRQLAIAGLGLARIGQFHVQKDLDAGTLVPVLDDYNPEDMEFIHAVFAGHEHMAARIRAFIDFLVESNPADMTV